MKCHGKNLFAICLALIIMMLLPVGARAELKEVNIGIPGHRGQETTLLGWQPTADYLTATIPGYRFTIVVTNFNSTEQMMTAGKIDFALVNPSLYVKLSKKYKATHLVTLTKKIGTSETSQLGSVIITRADSTRIASLADLKGKSFVAINELAFAGWQVAQYELQLHGITPSHLKLLKFTGYPVDRVVNAVLKGDADAGALPTGILEQMSAEGKLDLKDIRIINRQETPGFPFLHSTRLYPEYMLASLGSTDPGLAKKVAAQLLLYPGDSGSASTVRVAGWTNPASNEQVRILMQSLRLPPFENFGEVSFIEAIRQHWAESLLAALIIALLIWLTVRLKHASDRVKALTLLEESTAMYRELFEGAGDYLLVLSPPSNGTPPMILDANTAAFTRHGYLREEMVGQPVFFIDTEAAAEKNRLIGEIVLKQNGPLVFESEHRCRDGSTFPVEVSARLIKVGNHPPFILSIERDITERKQAEESLRWSEERFRVLFDKAANIAVQGYAPDGTILFWNKESEELFGYAASEAVGRNLVDLVVPPAMSGAARETIARMVDTGVGLPAEELTLLRMDGSAVPVYTNHTIIDIPGRGRELYCISVDLSKRMRAEEALVDSERKYHELLEELPDMVVVHKNGKVVYVNRMVEALSGFSREDLLGTNLLARVDEKDRNLVASNMARRMANEPVEDYEIDLLHQNGGSRRVIARTNLIQFEGEPAVVVILIDISHQKENERRIEHLNQMLRAIRCIDQLILRENDPVILSNEACKLLVEHRGYSETALLLIDEGVPMSWSVAGAGQEMGESYPQIDMESLSLCCINSKRFITVSPIPKSTADSCRSCSLTQMFSKPSICICLDYDEKLYGILLVTVETSSEIDDDEKALLVELAEDIAFALHAIKQGVIKERIQAERDQIESEFYHSQKMEAVGRLAGGVAHDFNNMLSVIIGYADLTKSQLDPIDPLFRNLQEIENAAVRSANLTRQLLAFSRKELASPSRVNLNESIREIYKMLERLIGEDIVFEFAAGSDLWDIWVDQSHIDQILANLTVNAKDAIGGVGAISINTSNVTIGAFAGHLSQLPAAGSYVRLAFTDTGCGMSKDTIERIFEPFFTTKGEGKGTGLGLSTVYGIVRQCDANIQVESEPGQGTTFTIHFPRYLGSAPEPAQLQQGQSLSGHESILLVEDNPQLLELAKTILETLGYMVLVAQTPDRAWQLSETYPGEIHLLLTDVIMPTMDGKELQSRIVARRTETRTLFMSGYTSEILDSRGVSGQGLNFIQKPFTVKSLGEKVRAVLEASLKGSLKLS